MAEKRFTPRFLLVLGLFLLIWATNSYFIIGNTGKNVVLFLGFGLIVFSEFKLKRNKEQTLFFILSLGLYILYLLIAYFNAQETLEPLNIAFSMICFCLLNIGFHFGVQQNKKINIPDVYYIIMALLTITGCLFFYVNQVAFLSTVDTSARDLGDEALNAVGVAYTHSILLLFMFWSLSMVQFKVAKMLILTALLCTLIVILSTLSRGALIYLALLFAAYYLRGAQLNAKDIVKFVLFFLGIIAVMIFLYQNNTFFQFKIDAVADRFENLVGFSTTNATTDLSAEDREEKYESFFYNISSYTLGELGYRPYPHNQFLEIFMRWGIFGIPLALFSLKLFYKSTRVFKKQILRQYDLLFLIVLLFLFSYLQSMTSMTLEMNRVMWLGFGFLAAIQFKPKSLKTDDAIDK